MTPNTSIGTDSQPDMPSFLAQKPSHAAISVRKPISFQLEARPVFLELVFLDRIIFLDTINLFKTHKKAARLGFRATFSRSSVFLLIRFPDRPVLPSCLVLLSYPASPSRPVLPSCLVLPSCPLFPRCPTFVLLSGFARLSGFIRSPRALYRVCKRVYTFATGQCTRINVHEYNLHT